MIKYLAIIFGALPLLGGLTLVTAQAADTAVAASTNSAAMVNAKLTLQNTATGLKLALHAPLSALLIEESTDAAANLMTQLQHADLLWSIPKAAQCEAQTPTIHGERLAQLLQHHSSQNSQLENSTRVPASLPRQRATASVLDDTDVIASYLYTCAKPEHLKGMNIKVMQVFPEIQHIDIQLSKSPSEQGLTAIRKIQLASPHTKLDW